MNYRLLIGIVVACSVSLQAAPKPKITCYPLTITEQQGTPAGTFNVEEHEYVFLAQNLQELYITFASPLSLAKYIFKEQKSEETPQPTRTCQGPIWLDATTKSPVVLAHMPDNTWYYQPNLVWQLTRAAKDQHDQEKSKNLKKAKITLFATNISTAAETSLSSSDQVIEATSMLSATPNIQTIALLGIASLFANVIAAQNLHTTKITYANSQANISLLNAIAGMNLIAGARFVKPTVLARFQLGQ